MADDAIKRLGQAFQRHGVSIQPDRAEQQPQMSERTKEAVRDFARQAPEFDRGNLGELSPRNTAGMRNPYEGNYQARTQPIDERSVTQPPHVSRALEAVQSRMRDPALEQARIMEQDRQMQRE